MQEMYRVKWWTWWCPDREGSQWIDPTKRTAQGHYDMQDLVNKAQPVVMLVRLWKARLRVEAQRKPQIRTFGAAPLVVVPSTRGLNEVVRRSNRYASRGFPSLRCTEKQLVPRTCDALGYRQQTTGDD